MTAHHGTPVSITSKGTSSQAGLQSYRHVYYDADLTEHPAHLCPECESELAYSRRLGESYCPDCDYARSE